MRAGLHGINHRGYTIIEVMIFMAVSGFMFVIAAAFISDKQSKAEFKQSMSAINSQVQSVINDVSNGFYPSNSDFTCQAASSGAPTLSQSSPNNPQGTNRGCVFGGKVIQFGTHNTNNKGYNIYSIAERQFASGGSTDTLPTNFTEAQPVVASDSASPPNFNLTEKNTLEWGTKVCGLMSGGLPINAIGFFQSFGSYGSGGSLKSGAQSINVVPITGTSTNGGEGESEMAAEVINLGTSNPSPELRPNIVVAFDSGNGQYATLTIGGGNGQRLTTAIKIINSPACSW